jgi:hypothetical protein
MKRGRRTALAGQRQRAGGAGDVDLLERACDLLHRQCGAGIRQVHDQLDAFGVVPAPGDPGGDIRLVLVIAADRLDRLAQHGAAQFLDRHFGGGEGPRAALVGKIAGHVVEHADGDRLRLRLSMREHSRAGQYAACREHGTYCHDSSRRRMRSFVR